MSKPALLDTWGRRNRNLADRKCDCCGKEYRPKTSKSRFCSHPCLWAQNGGHNRKPGTWWVNPKGYVEGRVWEGDVQRRVKQHRLIMEQKIGRRLTDGEIVHHLDGNKSNNDPRNLALLTHGEHSREHNLSRTYRSGYKMKLSDSERQRRSLWMKSVHVAKAEGRS